MSIELAMQRALTAQSHNKWLGPKCRNGKEKAAWADCLRLYQDTIAELNRTIDSKTKCTDFPGWLKAGDRKLLQTSSPTPNLVVAQDGSGNYRTIKAALDAAAQRSGSTRFVIRIKSGVYSENFDIGKNLKNIMLVGDGLRFTIITGSRSVGGGFTTFNSATVGKF
ncbi:PECTINESTERASE [Salix purpurea]|uniref:PECTINESTERASE n=1 Tax=Salix purpurea TaxID=77065 RepID=A0A9Q0W710_SALPP|nr:PECTINESTERASE [Salix purpurea]